MLLLSSTRLQRFFSLQSVSVTSAEKGRSHTSSFASEMTWQQQQQQRQQQRTAEAAEVLEFAERECDQR
jgi:hypothetical protein